MNCPGSPQDFTTLPQDGCKDRFSEPNARCSDTLGVGLYGYQTAPSLCCQLDESAENAGLMAEYGATCSAEYDSVVIVRHGTGQLRQKQNYSFQTGYRNPAACPESLLTQSWSREQRDPQACRPGERAAGRSASSPAPARQWPRGFPREMHIAAADPARQHTGNKDKRWQEAESVGSAAGGSCSGSGEGLAGRPPHRGPALAGKRRGPARLHGAVHPPRAAAGSLRRAFT